MFFTHKRNWSLLKKRALVKSILSIYKSNIVKEINSRLDIQPYFGYSTKKLLYSSCFLYTVHSFFTSSDEQTET